MSQQLEGKDKSAGHRPTRARRTQAERRQAAEKQIILSAIRIISEKGLGGLTLAAAGEGAGYSRGIASHHFGRKDDLLIAIVRYITSSFVRYLDDMPAKNPGLPVLLETVYQYFQGVKNDSVRMRALHLILTEAVSNTALKDALTEANLKSIAGLEEDIRSGIALGEIREDIDPHAQATLILAGLRGVMAQWLINSEMVNLDRVRDEYIAAIKRNLQA
ncbi:TetR/AcrR family transcriptional regulator [Proteobacteria bacterium 005FR1]|nr:TetR/AcrR family transcriptional regulator [Proteobacteria bacterium 005FR1]